MAVDFNATTSKVENTTAALSIGPTITMLAWVFADGIGETAGRVFQIDEAGNSVRLFHDTVVDRHKIAGFRSAVPAQFTFRPQMVFGKLWRCRMMLLLPLPCQLSGSTSLLSPLPKPMQEAEPLLRLTQAIA